MSGSKWGDLKPRVISAIVMSVVAAGAVWAGGIWFMALIAISSGLMIWELARMIAPQQSASAIQLGVISTIAIVLCSYLPAFYSAPLLLAPVAVGLGMIKTRRILFAPYALLILLAGFGFIYLRSDLGVNWMIWLLLVVVASDIGGYVAGRLFGGPKFWPSVSPKKTWSGTVAGWIGAALVGLAFNPAVLFVLTSVLVAFAAQMGDIAESAIKRKTGIKDSSNLIPGHGGFMDRFDGMLGASAVVILLVLLTKFPFVAG